MNVAWSRCRNETVDVIDERKWRVVLLIFAGLSLANLRRCDVVVSQVYTVSTMKKAASVYPCGIKLSRLECTRFKRIVVVGSVCRLGSRVVYLALPVRSVG